MHASKQEVTSARDGHVTGPGSWQVFEDDHVLSPGPDSGCPSESLLEEEDAPDPPPSPLRPPPPPDDPVLEWDPSVDIGQSVCREDAAPWGCTSSTGERCDPG